jgi:hypothetical protein
VTRYYVPHAWYQSPEISQHIATFAVCGCGVHVDVKADTLICPKCKALGVKAEPDGDPGRFPVVALYQRNESWRPTGADGVYACLGAPMCWCRKVPCVCEPICGRCGRRCMSAVELGGCDICSICMLEAKQRGEEP